MGKTKGTRLTGAQLIAIERERQINEEGYTPAHDDDTTNHYDLASGAASYLLHGDLAPDLWPFPEENFKPKDQLANYVRAGAMVAAAIDSLIRQQDRMNAAS